MTELQRYEPQTAELVPEGALVEWARGAQAAHGIAQSLVKTSFVPQPMRGKADEATAAILTGHELGLSPLASLRSIHIISGTPAMSALAMRALVQSRGHSVWVVEQSDTKAVVRGRRRGDGQEQEARWTFDRAKRLGLTVKDNWQKQPQAMLVARATAEVCRLIAADVLLGLPYAVEEIDEDTAPVKRLVRRKPVTEHAEPDVEPDVDEQTGEVLDEPTAAEPAIWPEVAQPGGAA